MSLQHIADISETRAVKPQKLTKDGLSTVNLIPTRANTPENYNSGEKYSSENSNDKASTIDSLTPTGKMLSAGSINSFDFSEVSSFEIDVCPKKKKFVNNEERRLFVEDYKRKYKTEMCKNWELRGTCKFGDKCCFAHGRHELKVKVLTHVKYKTKPCKQYHQTGNCPYGQRCQYLHKEAVTPNVFSNSTGSKENDPEIYDVLHEVNRLCNTDCDLKLVLDKLAKRNRLRVFGKLCCAA